MNTIAPPRSVKRLSLMISGFILLLTIGLVVFTYMVSPLRDPSYQPNSANAGSLIPWMRNFSESDWKLGANLLSVAVAISLTVLVRLFGNFRNFRSLELIKRTISKAWHVENLFAIGAITYFILTLGFILYLFHWGAIFVAIPIVLCLAVSITLLSNVRNFRSPNPVKRTIGKALYVLYWCAIGTNFYVTFFYVFLVYLLQQWIID